MTNKIELPNAAVNGHSVLSVTVDRPNQRENILGTVIAGRYKIVKSLGTGGMASVFQVIDQTIKRAAAVKLLLPKYATDPDTLRRFQLEATAASRLDHPNIVRIFEFGITDSGQPYLVMEYLPGKSLASLIKEAGRIDLATTLNIIIQTCDGLAQAHENGVVHRDLKPSNIMVLQSGMVKIVDFGIAKMLNTEDTSPIALTQTGDIFGSPPYMSPEQGLGREIDQRSDLYSLGCVMYECLTGSPPFTSPTALETLMKHQTENAPSLAAACFGGEFPDEIETVVSKLLAKPQKRRYQTAGSLRLDLLDFEQGHLDIARLLRDPVEEKSQRQDLTDFFERVHRPGREALDQISEPTPEASRLDNAIKGILLGLCFCAVAAILLLVFEVARNTIQSSPAPLDKVRLVKESDLRTPNSGYQKQMQMRMTQLINSPFPEIDLMCSNLTDEEWTKLLSIRDLRYIRAHGSSVGDKFIQSMPEWKLIVLDIADCRNLTADCLKKLHTFKSIQYLSLSADRFVGDDLADYLPPSLRLLEISRTPITDVGLKRLANSRKLRHLDAIDVSRTKVTDKGLSYLNALPSLNSLTVSGEVISSAGCANLKKLSNLRKLRVIGRTEGLEHITSITQIQELTVQCSTPPLALRRLQEDDLTSLSIERRIRKTLIDVKLIEVRMSLIRRRFS